MEADELYRYRVTVKAFNDDLTTISILFRMS